MATATKKKVTLEDVEEAVETFARARYRLVPILKRNYPYGAAVAKAVTSAVELVGILADQDRDPYHSSSAR